MMAEEPPAKRQRGSPEPNGAAALPNGKTAHVDPELVDQSSAAQQADEVRGSSSAAEMESWRAGISKCRTQHVETLPMTGHDCSWQCTLLVAGSFLEKCCVGASPTADDID